MSKLILNDFTCDPCGIFEELTPFDDKVAPCPKCGVLAQKKLSSPRLDWRMGVDDSFPTAADKWEKMQLQKSKHEDGYNLKHY